MFTSKRTRAPRQRMVLYLPTRAILPNPHRTRQVFDREEMQSLSDSISLYGILQPLTVRKKEAGWVLVAGERRLRAARMAGLREVPCIVAEDEAEDGLSSLTAHLQREDLNYIEQAEGIRRLMQAFGLSQTQAAARLGLSQSAVANKLRLLRHPPEILEALRACGLTERHARALLRAPAQERWALLLRADAEGWSVARLEAAVCGVNE